MSTETQVVPLFAPGNEPQLVGEQSRVPTGCIVIVPDDENTVFLEGTILSFSLQESKAWLIENNRLLLDGESVVAERLIYPQGMQTVGLQLITNNAGHSKLSDEPQEEWVRKTRKEILHWLTDEKGYSGEKARHFIDTARLENAQETHRWFWEMMEVETRKVNKDDLFSNKCRAVLALKVVLGGLFTIRSANIRGFSHFTSERIADTFDILGLPHPRIRAGICETIGIWKMIEGAHVLCDIAIFE